MNPGVSLRDRRQLALMADRLAGFRVGEVSLRHLIEDLNSIWSELEISGDWPDRFRSHWWTLEQVYAVAVDRDQVDQLPADLHVLVGEAVDAMSFLLDEFETAEGAAE